MPKKAKTPRPPRPVQAPQRRDARQRNGNRLAGAGGVPRWVWLVGIAVVAAIVAAVIALTGGSGKASAAKVKQTMLAAGCTYEDMKPLPPKTKSYGGYHADVPTLTKSMNGLWNTFPPAAGGHYPLWAVWGFYTQPVNPRQVVHNEEHGAVVIWWGPKVPASTVAKLRAFYNEPIPGGAGDGMFGTPLVAKINGKSLGDKIALTSWTGDPTHYYEAGDYGVGHVAICPSFNENAFKTFRDAYRGHGPEGIPLADDEPGMGPTS